MRGHRGTWRRPESRGGGEGTSGLPPQPTLGGTQSVTPAPSNPTSTAAPTHLFGPSRASLFPEPTTSTPKPASSTPNPRKKPSPFDIPPGGLPPTKRVATGPPPPPSLFGTGPREPEPTPAQIKKPFGQNYISPAGHVPLSVKGEDMFKTFAEGPTNTYKNTPYGKREHGVTPAAPGPRPSKIRRNPKPLDRGDPPLPMPLELWTSPIETEPPRTRRSGNRGRSVTNIPAGDASETPLQFPNISGDLDFQYPDILLAGLQAADMQAADMPIPDFEKDSSLKTKQELLQEVEYLKALGVVRADQIKSNDAAAKHSSDEQAKVTAEKLRTLRGQLIAIGSRSEDIEDEKDKYEAELEKTNAINRRLGEAVRDLSKKLAYIQRGGTHAQKLQAKLDAAEAQIKALQSADPTKATIKDQADKIHKLQQQLSSLGSHVEDLEAEVEALRKAGKTTGSESTNDCEDRLQATREDAEAAEEAEAEAQQDLAKSQLEREFLDMECSSLREMIKQFENGKPDRARKTQVKALEQQVKAANEARMDVEIQIQKEKAQRKTAETARDRAIQDRDAYLKRLMKGQHEVDPEFSDQGKCNKALKALQREHAKLRNQKKLDEKDVFELQSQLAKANAEIDRLTKLLEEYKSKSSTVPKSVYDALKKDKEESETQTFDRQEFIGPHFPGTIGTWYEKLWGNIDSWATNAVLSGEEIIARVKEDPDSVTEFRNLLSLHPEILLDSSKYGDEEISLIAAAMMKFIETRIIQKQPYEALHHIKETLKVVKKQMMTNTRQPRSERTADNWVGETLWCIFEDPIFVPIRQDTIERIYHEAKDKFGFLFPSDGGNLELSLKRDIIEEALRLNEAIISTGKRFSLDTPLPDDLETVVRESQDDAKLSQVLKNSGVANYAANNRRLNWNDLKRQWALPAKPTRKEIQDGLEVTSLVRPMLSWYNPAFETETSSYHGSAEQTVYDSIWSDPSRELLVEPKYLAYWAPKNSSKSPKPFKEAETLMSLLVGSKF